MSLCTHEAPHATLATPDPTCTSTHHHTNQTNYLTVRKPALFHGPVMPPPQFHMGSHTPA